MKIKRIVKKEIAKPQKVLGSFVGEGYVRTRHGGLPDVDSDVDGNKRDLVKAYLEKRYNKGGQRVFSVGNVITSKIKNGIRDVARAYKVPLPIVNYLTATINDEKLTWTGFMRSLCIDTKLKEFVQKYPEVFETLITILKQPRSNGIHASAIVTAPEYIKGEKVECFDVLPIRKAGDLLVSELPGTSVDLCGFLKNDLLGLQELSRFSDTLEIIEKEEGVRYTILQIANKYIDDQKVYEMLSEGYTCGVFQLSGEGMTKFIKRLQPSSIHDLIAILALFRPGPLSSGSAEAYIQSKRGEIEVTYPWQCEDILKRTYGLQIFQEQNSQVAIRVGKLSISDSIDLVKALSKKKIEQVRKFKDKFFTGAKENGCPKEQAEKIWSDIEASASYSFNYAHSTAYSLTAYTGAWLKYYYPIAFYSVILKDVSEDDLPGLLKEIEARSDIKLMSPDINVSDTNFVAKYQEKKIYWSLSRVKFLGPKAIEYILKERQLWGEFYDMEDFIKRIFKTKFKSYDDEGTEEDRERCPVTARSVRSLIYAGAFDVIENINEPTERYMLLEKAANMLGFEIDLKEVPEEKRDKHFFWTQMQMSLSGNGAIDYKRIYEDLQDKPSSLKTQRFIDFKDLNNVFLDARKGVTCATITSVSNKSFTDSTNGQKKHFGKIELLQNKETNVLTIWDAWSEMKPLFKKAEGQMIAFVANIKWSDYDEKNVLQINKPSFLRIL